MGLFGGTFDPPHNGHLTIARAAIQAFALRRMLFIPANIAPNKTSENHSAPQHRLAMLKLALQNEPACEIATLELERGGISYSIDTIRSLKTQMSLECPEFYFLIGADSLLELHTWRQPEDILTEVQVVVARRPGFDPSKVRPEYLGKIIFFDTPLIPISSSEIRKIALTGGRIDNLAPLAVTEYIHTNNLYRQIS
ncbi:MAG: nicotinate (nicotinamide) nucleotide adenylyltransferase [Candidatus Marinimicrobia bacterium]|nr:nicotinate (nicotinamide) nucleotide adenylyltransferase [Candidatus Neomarinimicrobiota bacterium]